MLRSLVIVFAGHELPVDRHLGPPVSDPTSWIFCDDLGYGDPVPPSTGFSTSLTSFYSTSGVCTPSRSSLLRWLSTAGQHARERSRGYG